MHPSFWLFKWKSSALCEEAKAVCQGVLCSNKLPLLSLFAVLFFPSLPLCSKVFEFILCNCICSICVQNIKCENLGLQWVGMCT